MRTRPLLAILAATAIVLFTTASTTHTGTGGAQACAPQPAGNTPITVNSGGLVRTALVHVPPLAARGRPLPLVLAFHGAGWSGAWMEDYTGLSGVSDKAGFLVAYPDAYGKARVWNYSGPSRRAPDDVAFGRDLLTAIQQRFCADPGRAFATGVSNGGGMAARLGCELSDRLLAIAPVAGGYSKLPPCRPARPLSVLEIHDNDDPVVPYKGRGPAGDGNVPRYVRAWAQRDRCPVRSGFSRPNRRVLRRYWAPCSNGVTVEQLIVLGGGHEWPGGRAGRRGRPESISANGQIWRFFAASRR